MPVNTDYKKSNFKLFDGNNANPLVISHSASGTQFTSVKDDGSGSMPLTFTQVLAISDGVHTYNNFVADYTALKNLQTSNHSSQGTLISNLQSDLSSEVVRAQSAETQNAAAVQAEVSRAVQAESALNTAISAEASERLAGDTALTTSLNEKFQEEQAARIDGDDELQSSLDAEVLRAQNAEANLQTQITAVLGNATPDHLNSLSEIIAHINTADDSLTALINALTTRVANLEGTVAAHLSD